MSVLMVNVPVRIYSRSLAPEPPSYECASVARDAVADPCPPPVLFVHVTACPAALAGCCETNLCWGRQPP